MTPEQFKALIDALLIIQWQLTIGFSSIVLAIVIFRGRR
jgi:hypothetical protein